MAEEPSESSADKKEQPPPEPEAPAPEPESKAAEAPKAAPPGEPPRPSPRRTALLLYLAAFVIYALFASERLLTHSPDNHFAYLADSYLHGTLEVRCDPAAERAHTCPPAGGGNDWAHYNGHWYVAFPPFPAVVYMPAVALLGREFANRWVDVAVGALAPALLYLLLERLSREGRSERTPRENLLFSALFGFGTVFFFSSVQGSVWFTAHVVSASLAVGYLWFALDARNPLLAGLFMALAMQTRAPFVWASPFFALEALRVARGGTLGYPREWLRGLDRSKLLRALVLFAIPMALSVALSLWLNKARFDDAFEVGYRHLQIGWRGRIERWGLFNYHYLSRNLAIALASLPWITRDFPHVVIPLHGVALWFTTPHFLELARLRRRVGDPYTPFLVATAGSLALQDLLYQNSGWIQFGYRFSNDFAIFLLVLLAINGSKVGRAWKVAFALAVAINAFGAWSFDRQIPFGGRRISFYDNDTSQQRYFQPD